MYVLAAWSILLGCWLGGCGILNFEAAKPTLLIYKRVATWPRSLLSCSRICDHFEHCLRKGGHFKQKQRARRERCCTCRVCLNLGPTSLNVIININALEENCDRLIFRVWELENKKINIHEANQNAKDCIF
jgi:hypothetical protein